VRSYDGLIITKVILKTLNKLEKWYKKVESKWKLKKNLENIVDII
jgi:hypothetical protein